MIIIATTTTSFSIFLITASEYYKLKYLFKAIGLGTVTLPKTEGQLSIYQQGKPF